MRNRVNSDAIQSHSAPAYFICAIAIDLKNPPGPNVAKKIAEMPNRRESEIHNIVLRIQIPANDEGLEQIEKKLPLLIGVLDDETRKPLGLGPRRSEQVTQMSHQS